MGGFLSTLTLGVIAAVIGSYLQHRSWRHRTQEDIFQKEFKEATTIVTELGTAVDKRYVAQHAYFRKVETGNADEEAISEIREAIDKWLEEFSYFKSKILLYFGNTAARKFETEIHRLLVETTAVIARTKRYGYEELSQDHKIEYDRVLRRMNFTRYVTYKYLNELNERIANREFGRTQLINNIHLGHLDDISRTYLIQRLLGLKS